MSEYLKREERRLLHRNQAAAILTLFVAVALLAILGIDDWKNWSVVATAVLVVLGYANWPTGHRGS